MKALPHYFCLECKKNVENFESLYFIDKFSSKGFCSLECIEDFYLPIVSHFERFELECREKLNLVNENLIVIDPIISRELSDPEKIIYKPSDVFELRNELGDTYYIFVKSVMGHHALVLATVYDRKLSFIFLHFITASKSLLDAFKFGESILNEWNHTHESENDEEIMDFDIEKLEAKKSQFLAQILEVKSDKDIEFENYNQFSELYEETINNPEDIYCFKDKEGDLITVFINSYLKTENSQGQPVFYLILTYGDQSTRRSGQFLNKIFLSFPSVDEKLVFTFRRGQNLGIRKGLS